MVFLTGCGSPFGSTAAALKPIASPDGLKTLNLSVNQSEVDPTKYLCVMFELRDKSGNLLHTVQTSASDIQKWAAGWFDDTTIVIYSSDIGTSAWKLVDDGTIAKVPSPLSTELTDYGGRIKACLLYTSPSPRDATLSRMPSSA